jgi:hypothetical protein
MIQTVGLNDDIRLNEVDNDFVNMINDRITIYGMLPYTVPRRLIVALIQQSARIFYSYSYYTSQENRLMLLPKEEILKYAPKEGNKIKHVNYVVPIPLNINAIKEIYETNISERSILSDEELEKNILFDSTSYGQNIYGINNNMFMFDMAAKMIQYQAVRAVFSKPVMWHFVRSKHQIVFYETSFSGALILDCMCNVNVETLYNDALFIRHVIASVKEELKRLIGSHTVTLPGEVQISAEEICSNIEDKAAVEETLKSASTTGDIILFR